MKTLKKRNWLKTLIIAALVLALLPVQASAVGSSTGTLVDLRHLDNWPESPEIEARSGCLIELNSGEILYGKNEDETRYPASITKVMTALIVCENCDLSETVTFSHEAVTDIEEGGESSEYREGETLTVEQCLYALLLDSVNECGYALAEHVAGSVSGFAELMNKKAAELGCTKTHFANPHGLNDENHTTTAKDMALIFRAALQNETFYQIDSTLDYTIPATERNPEGFKLHMHHKMMDPASDWYDERVKAGKTGYTSIAKNTLVSYAEKDGVELVAVIMKDEGNGLIYSDTKKLLDFGFGNFTMQEITGASGNLATALRAAFSLPLNVDDKVSVYLPEGSGQLSVNFAAKDVFDPAGTVGRLEYRLGDTAIAAKPILVNAAAMNTAAGTVPVESAPETSSGPTEQDFSTDASETETGEAGVTETAEGAATDEQTTAPEGETQAAETQTGEAQTAETTAAETEKSGPSFFGIVLRILLVLIAAVAVYWIVVQVLKRRRRERRRKEILERRRRQKMRER